MFKFLTDLGVTSDSPHFFLAHPAQVSRWLDEVWLFGPQQLEFQELPPPDGTGALRVLQPFLGDAGVVTSLGAPDPLIDPAGLALTVGKLVLPPGFNDASPSVLVGKLPIWHHLIYAYLLENTGMFEIFAEVVRRATSGETLEISGQPAVQWVRNTEELFFRDPPLFSVGSITSHIRPDERSVRRNAYWRMFGMDFSHDIPPRWGGRAGTAGWKADVGAGVNTSFREKWSELLRQVWLGYENRKNSSGANATDDAYLLLLCDSIRDMLNMRRRGAALAREEFKAVAVMSWFDETLQFNTPIVQTLKATATSPADRLALVGRAVGMTPAPRSRELFELAELMSLVLRTLESGVLNTEALVAHLYKASALGTTMNRIIDLWQSATGERVKDRPIGNLVAAGAQQPLRIPGPQPLTLARPALATGTGGRP